MTRNSTLAFSAIIVVLLACKGTKDADDDQLPEAPALPTAEEDSESGDGAGVASASASADPEAPADEGAAEPSPAAPAAGTGRSGAARDAGADDEADSSKDAGTTAPAAVDATVGDMQKRAQRCIKRCSAQFEKCKAVDISKLPECVQKQANCSAACK